MTATLRPSYLLEPPSVLHQTDWPCGFYEFPDTTPPSVNFNCGLVACKAGLEWLDPAWLFARRQVFYGKNVFLSSIVCYALNGNEVGDQHLVTIKGRYGDEHVEDPRVFAHEGKIYMAWTSWRRTVPGNRAHQAFGVIEDNFAVNNPMHLVFGQNGPNVLRNRGHEKNWVWFMDGHGLHVIYSMNPHIVALVEDGKVVKTEAVASKLPWNYGEARGGTPPVRVGVEYYCFFHSSQPWIHPYRRYFAGAYAFDAKPPYKIVGMTTHPLLFGSLQDPRWNNSGPIVVFPCGSMLRDGVWKVTMGINDCRSAWLDIPHEDLVARMVAV